MPELRIRKDLDKNVVEVNTGDGWRGISPTGARQMADAFETEIDSGKRPDSAGTREIISTLRQYAADLEGRT